MLVRLPATTKRHRDGSRLPPGDRESVGPGLDTRPDAGMARSRNGLFCGTWSRPYARNAIGDAGFESSTLEPRGWF